MKHESLVGRILSGMLAISLAICSSSIGLAQTEAAPVASSQEVTSEEAKTPDAATPDKVSQDTRFWNEKLKPFFTKHCVECHSGEEAEAGIDLALVDDKSPIENNVRVGIRFVA